MPAFEAFVFWLIDQVSVGESVSQTSVLNDSPLKHSKDKF